MKPTNEPPKGPVKKAPEKPAKKPAQKRPAKKSKSPTKSTETAGEPSETPEKTTETTKPKRSRTKSPAAGLGPIIEPTIPIEAETAEPSDSSAGTRRSTRVSYLAVAKKVLALQGKVLNFAELAEI